MVATSTARHRALRTLPIVTHNCDCREGEDKKGGLQGKTLKRVRNVSVSYYRSPSDDYGG